MKHFKLREFDCPCCASNIMHPLFLTRLDMLRDACGFPFVITSGYRCEDYNARKSTTGRNGPHTTGRAADIAVYGPQAVMLVSAALQRQFKGIGVHQRGPTAGRFVHLDDLDNLSHCPRPRIWSY